MSADQTEWRFGCGVLFVAVTVSFAVGTFFGGLFETGRLYHRKFLQERNLIAPVLASDPAFAALEIIENSQGDASLSGTVPLDADLGRLRFKLIQVVGEPKTKFVMTGVYAERRPNAAPP